MSMRQSAVVATAKTTERNRAGHEANVRLANNRSTARAPAARRKRGLCPGASVNGTSVGDTISRIVFVPELRSRRGVANV
jgi:hypothetical protein